jgi:hypothetical protein
LFVGVLVCLTLCTLMMGALLKNIVAARRGSDRYENGLQSLFLAEAGVQRAARQLSLNPAYQGESWEIPADVPGRFHGAVVQIRVEALESDGQTRRIYVESQYPVHPTSRVVQTRDMTIQIPRTDGGET